MNETVFTERLQQIAGSENVFTEEPLRDHTSFGIGGPAQWFVTPRTEEAIAAVVSLSKQEEVPLRVLGLGANVLVPDEGLRGVTLSLAQNFSEIEVIPGGLIKAQAGATNAEVAHAALDAHLEGYEFASGIPGTMGGAAIMNAGAYDGQFSDVCVSVRTLMPDGSIETLSAEEAGWGYRTSRFMREGLIVVGVILQLHHGNAEEIAARMADLKARREEKQPLDYPSSGSTFKRPPNNFAGKLIREAGMQGARVGGAQVSTKHAGFVVNTGDATAADVLELIALIQEKVEETSGVRLEPEVHLWD